jgi:hypothetical protein
MTRWLTRAAMAVLFVASLVLASAWRSDASMRRQAAAAPALNIPKTVRRPAYRTGRQVVVMFIGASTCNAAGRLDVQEAFLKLRQRLGAEARAAGKQITFVGVSTDWTLAKGLDFLSHYGAFDEVVVGGNWMNSSVVSYVWRDVPGAPMLPQVVVLERAIEVNDGSYTVSADRLIARKLGADEMIQWSRELSKRASLP